MRISETLKLPESIEAHRDRFWHRDPELRIDDANAAEQFIERVGFCAALTDSRRLGPSLYVAVCGRRDAHTPRNVQKDPETSLSWRLKDELVRRGRVYYGKLTGNRATFLAPRLIPAFQLVWGVKRNQESAVLSPTALSILKTLRNEFELSTGDLRKASGIKSRPVFTKALNELQRTLKVIPNEVVYDPTFTYIWTIVETRFPQQHGSKLSRMQALTEIARAYLNGAGMTLRGELARVTGLSNAEAGLGNWSLVDEGFAERLGPGIYRLTQLTQLF